MTLMRQLEALFAHMGQPASAAQKTQLVDYLALVEQWNAKMDLTAATDAERLVEVLLADSCALTSLLHNDVGVRGIDVGSGAGAPCLPFVILRPDTSWTLVEPLKKRVAFLRTVIGTLGLSARVQVLAKRIEETSWDKPFDVAMARATFEPQRWLDVGSTLAERVVVFTTDEPPVLVSEQFRCEKTLRYTLPFTHAPRVLTLHKKQ